MHIKKLSEVGKVVRAAPPLALEHVREYFKRFLVESSTIDKRDIQLHDFLLTAMNCGMRYDELSKIQMQDVTATKYGIEFGVGQRCKKLTKYRTYTVRRWPGDHFLKCLMMDPLFSLSAWIHVRGNQDGYLFCEIGGRCEYQRIVLHEPWSRNSFVNFMQNRFTEIGIGSEIASAHTGHSPKRGAVQLLRFIGCEDQFLMKWFGMAGQQAYLRYTEGFKDASGLPVPDFASVESMRAHNRARNALDSLLVSEEENEIGDWLSDFENMGV